MLVSGEVLSHLRLVFLAHTASASSARERKAGAAR
jgi:hypothetical protein